MLKFTTLVCLVILGVSCNYTATNEDSSDQSTTANEDTSNRTDLSTLNPGGSTKGEREFDGTREDSLKTKANPLYKGDNSDTGKRQK